MKLQLSYSKLSCYEQCPRQFKVKYVTKTYPNESDNPYFVKGHKIHKELDDYIIAKQSDKKTSAKVGKIAQRGLRMIDVTFNSFDEVASEKKISVDKSFKEVTWFDKTTYYRSIFDMVAKRDDSALLVDWKTGKVRDYDSKPTGQLHLGAAILLSTNPEINTVTTAYVFVEHKQSIKMTFYRKNLAESIDAFHAAYDEVAADTEFKPKVNRNCFFCRVSPADCEFKK